MNKKIKIVVAIILVILTITIWTNPSINNFKEFSPSAFPVKFNDFKSKITLSRKSNYLFYSKYIFRWNETGAETEFIGFFNNFYINDPKSYADLRKYLYEYRRENGYDTEE